ncbi:ABC transporter ATP-binding protein [Plantactinospora sp. CA-290183]|uniref:ABC transporter ATP-binding protein n=1 Tax=Plantactinospora sp. CA-290183 TaxID=3240006 RepID=UPI003D92FBD3
MSAGRTVSVWREIVARSWRLDRRITALIGFLLVAQVGAFAATGLAIRAIVDQVADGALEGVFLAALVGGLGFGLATIGAYVQFELRSDLADRIGYLQIDPEIQNIAARIDGLGHLERADYVDRLNMLRGKGYEIAAAGWAVPETVALVVQLGVTLILLGSVHPLLLLLLVLTVPAVLLNRRAYHGVSEAALASAEDARVEQHMHEIATRASAGKEIRVNGTAGTLMKTADDAWRRVSRLQTAARARAAGLAVLSSALFVVGYAGGLAFVVYLVADGRRSIGDLILVIILAGQLRGDFQWVQYNLTHMRRGMALATPYRWLVAHAQAQAPKPGRPAPQRLERGIRLENVSFHYAGNPDTVLGPLTVDLPAGGVVAIVGEHGSGKTTLVKLLSKFYRPQQGRITVDGVDLDDIDTEQWRAATSAAFQDFVRYEIKAGHAIGIGDLPALDDEDRLRQAVREADAVQIIDRLPDGLDTQLGRRFDGVDLSEGQWQRVALARGAMRQNPVLVLLDEPTASLDAVSEHAIFERHAALARRLGAEHGTITLMVSHRFSTIWMADLILVVSAGRVIERGTHDELIAAGGTYAELYDIQRRAYAG